MTGVSSAIKMISGEVLFREGQMADHFYLIEQGSVLILDQAGRNVIRVYEADQLFGLPEVLAKAVWGHTAIVGSRALIKTFPAELLFQRVGQMPITHQDFIQEMAKLGLGPDDVKAQCKGWHEKCKIGDMTFIQTDMKKE